MQPLAVTRSVTLPLTHSGGPCCAATSPATHSAASAQAHARPPRTIAGGWLEREREREREPAVSEGPAACFSSFSVTSLLYASFFCVCARDETCALF